MAWGWNKKDRWGSRVSANGMWFIDSGGVQICRS